jgi:putative zinc finger/helix-turn-helix YgiT family protein
MKCAFCGGNAVKKTEINKINFRKEEFKIHKHFYECSNCKERFTTDELDNLNMKQVYNQYREKHSIPFPEQLIKARDNYGLSAAKMAEVLGFGSNIYRNYENGEVPNLSNGTLLNVSMDSNEFLKIVENKSNLFSKGQIEKVIANIKRLMALNDSRNYLKKLLWDDIKIPNELSGYTIPSFNKFANVVLFFLELNKNTFKVRMNKLLFYADFLHFKRTGQSITGYKYHAIQMGPVPYRYDAIYDLLTHENIIDFVFEEIKNNPVDKPVAINSFDEKLFVESELTVLDEVYKRFKNISTEALVELSHKEKGWIEENKKKGIISYQKYGYELNVN